MASLQSNENSYFPFVNADNQQLPIKRVATMEINSKDLPKSESAQPSPRQENLTQGQVGGQQTQHLQIQNRTTLEQIKQKTQESEVEVAE